MAKIEPLVTSTKDLTDGMVALLSGEIDYSRAPDLRRQLMAIVAQKKPVRLVLDLSAVPYMDSSGVATLIELLQAQRRAKGRLILCNLQPKVRGIFEIARLTTVFEIAASAANAEKA